MKYKCPIILVVLFILSAPACSVIEDRVGPGGCTGVHETMYHSGVDITSVDTIATTNGRYRHVVVITSVNVWEKGNRSGNCQTLEYAIGIGDVIDTATINITCNRNFHWYNKRTVYAGENLKNIDIFTDHFGGWTELYGHIKVNIDADSVETGVYKFHVSCSTKEGKQFADSLSVYYR